MCSSDLLREMSAELRQRISTDIRAVAADSEIASRLLGTGQVLRGSTPEEFAAKIEKQRVRMAEIVRALGTKPIP